MQQAIWSAATHDFMHGVNNSRFFEGCNLVSQVQGLILQGLSPQQRA